MAETVSFSFTHTIPSPRQGPEDIPLKVTGGITQAQHRCWVTGSSAYYLFIIQHWQARLLTTDPHQPVWCSGEVKSVTGITSTTKNTSSDQTTWLNMFTIKYFFSQNQQTDLVLLCINKGDLITHWMLTVITNLDHLVNKPMRPAYITSYDLLDPSANRTNVFTSIYVGVKKTPPWFHVTGRAYS